MEEYCKSVILSTAAICVGIMLLMLYNSMALFYSICFFIIAIILFNIARKEYNHPIPKEGIDFHKLIK